MILNVDPGGSFSNVPLRYCEPSTLLNNRELISFTSYVIVEWDANASIAPVWLSITVMEPSCPFNKSYAVSCNVLSVVNCTVAPLLLESKWNKE